MTPLSLNAARSGCRVRRPWRALPTLQGSKDRYPSWSVWTMRPSTSLPFQDWKPSARSPSSGMSGSAAKTHGAPSAASSSRSVSAPVNGLLQLHLASARPRECGVVRFVTNATATERNRAHQRLEAYQSIAKLGYEHRPLVQRTAGARRATAASRTPRPLQREGVDARHPPQASATSTCPSTSTSSSSATTVEAPRWPPSRPASDSAPASIVQQGANRSVAKSVGVQQALGGARRGLGGPVGR